MMNVSLLAMSSVGHQWHEVPVSSDWHTVSSVSVRSYQVPYTHQTRPATVAIIHHSSTTINILDIFPLNVNDNFINFNLY